MKKFSLIPVIALILAAGFPLNAQQQTETAAEIKAKHAAYFLCIGNMGKEPQKALEDCAAYLKKYPDDDARLTEFAGTFVKRFSAANEKISAYLKSVPVGLFTENSDSSAIYKPDLERVIPIVSETEGNYKIEISRRFDLPDEEKLLNKAEAVYRTPKDVSKNLYENWNFAAQENFELPNGEAKWWVGFNDSILSTEIVTTGAVLYYYNLSLNLHAAKGKIRENGFTFINTNLKYDSSIKKIVKYERAGKTFENVYVADMTLTWGQVCGGLCGHGFTRNKVVVLSEKGDVLGMFLDAPVNRTSWVS